MGQQASNAELEAWVVASAPRAVAYARSLLGNPDEAEDVVQDCYCRLLQHAGRYNLPEDGMKLLLTAISNACLNRRTRRKPWFSLSPSEEPDGPVWEPADARSQPPDAGLLHAELQEAVRAGLALLPAMQRAALELKALDYSQQDIAEILGTSPGNVGVLLHRGRQALAAYLKPYLRDA